MKILLVSDWEGGMHAEAFSKAWSKIGIEVVEFSWRRYFSYDQSAASLVSLLASLWNRLQNKYVVGPAVFRLNRDLLSLCAKSNPDLVFVYRGTHIFPATLKNMKLVCGSKVFGYHNDDPFSKNNSGVAWRLFHKSLREYDHIFSYRNKNLVDYAELGHTNTSLLRSSYIKDRNFPLISDYTRRLDDVVFVGHYEDDGRDEVCKQLLEFDFRLKIYGPEWKRSIHYGFLKERIGPISPAVENYTAVLNSAKIALVFLSKINRDAYTRRCFEIPATKTLMVCEYSDDMAENLFREDEEAVYFRSFSDLSQKLKWYLENLCEAERIADNGYKRLVSDGHSVEDRCRQVIAVYKSLVNGDKNV